MGNSNKLKIFDKKRKIGLSDILKNKTKNLIFLRENRVIENEKFNKMKKKMDNIEDSAQRLSLIRNRLEESIIPRSIEFDTDMIKEYFNGFEKRMAFIDLIESSSIDTNKALLTISKKRRNEFSNNE